MHTLVAHSHNKLGDTQSLIEHLTNVAMLAEQFGSVIGLSKLARLAGLLHDIGKAKTDWQKYLSLSMSHQEAKKVDHKGAGAAYASKLPVVGKHLSMVIAGHHGGMLNLVQKKSFHSDDPSLKGLLANPAGEWQAGRKEVEAVLADFLSSIDKDTETIENGEAFIKLLFLFSCLVDADSIDTGSHFLNRVPVKQDGLTLLLDKLSAFQQTAQWGNVSPVVKSLREQVRHECVLAAPLAPGFFTLNAPTGLGKTIAVMEFALRHAIHHDMRGVRVIAPYRSIIDQTCAVYSGVFGAQNVLGHHSTAEFWVNKQGASWKQDKMQRQIAENWDCPIVVSTMVQFFDSLFCSRPGAARKIHNVANSVVVLDEVQTLPTHLLYPLFEMLKALVTTMKCTVVFSTATMPRIKELLNDGTTVSDIVTDAQSLFTQAKRVTVDVINFLWAEEVAAHHQCLCIMNTRKRASILYKQVEAINPDGLFFLSTQMCSRHRSAVIAEIRERLKAGERCVVISTQLVEAGVDFDFPVLYRAMAPLDSIIQSAGRCNRNGLLEHAVCHVIRDWGGEVYPDADYKRKAEVTQALLSYGDAHDLDTLDNYNAIVSDIFNLDKHEIRQAMNAFAFGYLRENFSLIDSPQVSLIVQYGTEEEQATVAAAVAAIHHAVVDDTQVKHSDIRALQGYTVTMYENALEKLDVTHLCLNYYLFNGAYDAKTGLA